MSLNASAWEDLLKKQNEILMFFDPSTRMIGIRPATTGDDPKNVMKMFASKTKSMATLPIAGLLKRFGVEPGHRMNLPLREADDGMLVAGPVPAEYMQKGADPA
jgi:hypothetical protein